MFSEAAKYYPKSEKECKNKSLEIEKDLDSLFINAKKERIRKVGFGHEDPWSYKTGYILLFRYRRSMASLLYIFKKI